MFLRKLSKLSMEGARTRTLQTLCSLFCKSGPGKSGSGKADDGSDGKGILMPSCLCPSDTNPSAPTMYDTRKYGHCLPANDRLTRFENLCNIPTGVFRCTTGETLGAGADKCCCYQCPEYFSYQHMSFYDLHLYLSPCRKPSPKTGRKP